MIVTRFRLPASPHWPQGDGDLWGPTMEWVGCLERRLRDQAARRKAGAPSTEGSLLRYGLGRGSGCGVGQPAWPPHTGCAIPHFAAESKRWKGVQISSEPRNLGFRRNFLQGPLTGRELSIKSWVWLGASATGVGPQRHLLFDNLVVTPQFVCFGQYKTGRNRASFAATYADDVHGQTF